MWQRWNQTTHIFEKSSDNGGSWTPLGLDGAIITEGTVAAARLPALSALSGTLNKSQQHAQTAYKDEANDFVTGQRILGTTPTLIFAPGGVSRAYLINDGSTNLYCQLDGAVLFTNAAASTTRFRINSDGSLFERNRSVAIGEWTTYTPSWTNLTVGDGTNQGRYSQIGKIVFIEIALTFGSTTSITGVVTVSLPINMRDANYSQVHVTYLRSGVAWLVGGIQPGVSSTLAPGYTADTIGSLGSVTALTPFTWGTNDRIILNGWYEIS